MSEYVDRLGSAGHPQERTKPAVKDVVITLLSELGYVSAGQTATETVRIPTRRAPVYGGIGGEVRTFGGRARLRVPDRECYVTVGARTTYFYRVTDGRLHTGMSFRTSEVDAIAAYAR